MLKKNSNRVAFDDLRVDMDVAKIHYRLFEAGLGFGEGLGLKCRYRSGLRRVATDHETQP